MRRGTATAEVVAALRRYRFTFSTEEELQEALSEALTGAGLAHEREVQLTPRDRPDLMREGLAIEVKIAGRAASLLRQVARYAEHDDVVEVLVVTNRRQLASGLPEVIRGKPLTVLNLAEIS